VDTTKPVNSLAQTGIRDTLAEAPAQPEGTFRMGKYGTCKKDANGHTKCLDFSDGYKRWKYCRKSAWGKVTCSDRDHSDWWAEEDATEEFGRQKWDAENMTYKGRQCQNKAGKIRCPDSDSRRMDFCGYNQTGKFSCSDWDKGYTAEAPAQPEGTFRMGKYGTCKKDEATGVTNALTSLMVTKNGNTAERALGVR